MTEKNQSGITRRGAMVAMAGAVCVGGASTGVAAAAEEKKVKGRIKQSVSRWCFSGVPLDDLCVAAKEIGLVGIDLLSEEDWATVQGHGLIPTMANGPGNIPIGWNNPKHHDKLVKKSEELLPKVAKAGLPNMIVFSGNRKGMPDSEGLKNCVTGLKRIMPLAEELGVNVMMELLNSKRSHKDYMCDHTAWGVNLAKELGSDRFKLLYDIFHMQIMEGDIIDTFLENIDYIGHIHTGGVPGRNDINETQELNYRRIAQAVAESDFDGFFAHEFVPKNKKDPLPSLREAFKICDV